MKRLKIYLSITFTLLITINLASAYEVKHTLKELVSSSPLIIVGKVSEISSKIEDTGKQELIYTYVEVSITSTIKGIYTDKSVTIKMAGGKVGKKGGWSTELRPFDKEEEVILFLHPKDQSEIVWTIPSISGKLSISHKEDKKLVGTSMLRNDNITTYGPNSFSEYDDIIGKINSFLNKEE